MTCTVCGQPGVRGHEHTSRALCLEHAAWWREALTERTSAADWDAEGDLRDDAHDELMQSMRLDYADAPEGVVMTADPLDGIELYGVGVAS